MDDGSPDSTGTLCDELASADSRITALHRANGGAGAARNTGLDAATGDWVLFLDADDELLPGLWDALAALDDTAQKADLLLFRPVRGPAAAISHRGAWHRAFTRICPHWALRWSRCCLTQRPAGGPLPQTVPPGRDRGAAVRPAAADQRRCFV